METAIIVIWTITLIVALTLTLWILKLVILIVRTERDIISLAETTLKASQGIERNTALITELEVSKGAAGKILHAAMTIETGANLIRQKLSGVEKELKQRSL